MKKKLIQLDPANPPLYPLINVLKGWSDDDIKPFNDNDLATLNQQMNDLLGTKEFGITGIWDVSKLDNNGALRVVDLSLGRMLSYEEILSEKSLLDLTGLPVFSYDLSGLSTSAFRFSIDHILGVELNVTLLLEKNRGMTLSKITSKQQDDLRFISRLIADYQMQKDLIKRDLKYKSALLQNLLEHPKLIKVHIGKLPFPSPVFAFFLAKSSEKEFIEEVEKSGFGIGKGTNKNGNDHFLIANYINHSKEQLERFIDQMDNILNRVLL